jgi:hypothetical protein
VSDRQSLPPPPGNGEPILVNTTYWFERELRQYPVVDLDLDALGAHAGSDRAGGGQESRGYPVHEVTVRLARKLVGSWSSCPAVTWGFCPNPPSSHASWCRRWHRRAAPITCDLVLARHAARVLVRDLQDRLGIPAPTPGTR